MIFADKENDGLMMAYICKGIIYPVVLEKEQKQMLETVVSMALNGKINILKDKPLGEVEWRKI